MSTPTDVDEPAVDTEVDPRIQARREQVQQDLSRQRGRRFLVVAIAGAVLATGFWIFRSPLLDVDRITVEGADHTGVEAVQAATGVSHGDRLSTAPLTRIAARVQELPWVESATVRRSWPGTLVVTVVERSPLAAAELPVGNWLLIDRTGRQLDAWLDPGPDVVRLQGVTFTPEPGKKVPPEFQPVIDLAASMPERLRGMVVDLRPAGGNGGEIDGTLLLPEGGRPTVRFGRPDQFERKWLALLALVEDVDLTRKSQIDVRVPAVPVLTPR